MHFYKTQIYSKVAFNLNLCFAYLHGKSEIVIYLISRLRFISFEFQVDVEILLKISCIISAFLIWKKYS